MWLFKSKKREALYDHFLYNISEIERLERENEELYRFCIDVCKEIYKYTGRHDWLEKLHMMIKNRQIT